VKRFNRIIKNKIKHSLALQHGFRYKSFLLHFQSNFNYDIKFTQVTVHTAHPKP